MTEYTLNRPGEAGRLDQYPRYPGQMGSSLNLFPADYVGALTGALGQIDINSMVSRPHLPRHREQ